MGQNHVPLSVIVFAETIGNRKMFIAQCLQYDICVQAREIGELKKRFQQVVVGNLILALLNDEVPFAHFKPAPGLYWNAFDAALALGEDFPVSIPADRLPKREVSQGVPRTLASMKMASGPLECQHIQ